MTVKTTESCVQSLLVNGINIANVMVQTPKIILDTFKLHNFNVEIDVACQTNPSSASSEDWFEEVVGNMGVMETELDIWLAEAVKNNLRYDPVDCIIQAINSIHFEGPQCPILKLQDQLQAINLKVEVLTQNPLFFEMFKQKLYKEFQGCLFWYWPLLEYVNIRDFQWQVMWLWEFLVNTPIDEGTYDWLRKLIKV